MVTYQIIYDETQDAYNWYSAIVNFNQQAKLKDEQDIKIATKIQGLDFDHVKKILIPYLKNSKSTQVRNFQKIISQQFDEYFEAAIEKLEKATNHPIAVKNCAKNRAVEIAKIDPKATPPKKDLLILITTFPAMIVYYEEGTIYSYAKTDDSLWGMPLDGILHELMHFQTDYYYRENPKSPVSKLSDEEYYILKESLPVLLDESWKPIITLPDCSYQEYQPLRDQLHKFYQKNPNFDHLMTYGAKEVVKFENCLLNSERFQANCSRSI